MVGSRPQVKTDDPFGEDFLSQVADVPADLLRERLDWLTGILHTVVSQIDRLEVERNGSGRPHLRARYRPSGRWQTEADFSDGTLRLIGLLWAHLVQPTGPLIVEEPELSLHPEIVRRLPLPPEIDREGLVTTLEAREAMGSTGIGDGIAIPHVRNPILLHVTAPFVTLCLLREAVDFDAVDGRPVHALFTVVSANVPGHLRILGSLGFVLHDEELRRLLSERAPGADLLARVRVVEGRASGASLSASQGPS